MWLFLFLVLIIIGKEIYIQINFTIPFNAVDSISVIIVEAIYSVGNFCCAGNKYDDA